MGTIHITLVANAGLLLESGGRKLLLDGLHSRRTGCSVLCLPVYGSRS